MLLYKCYYDTILFRIKNSQHLYSSNITLISVSETVTMRAEWLSTTSMRLVAWKEGDDFSGCDPFWAVKLRFNATTKVPVLSQGKRRRGWLVEMAGDVYCERCGFWRGHPNHYNEKTGERTFICSHCKKGYHDPDEMAERKFFGQ